MSTPSEQEPTEPRYGQYAPPGWQAPGGGGTPPPPAPGWDGAPGWGAEQPIGYQQQMPMAAPVPPMQPFRPMAAQPGIVPLRPLSVWEIIDGAFRAVRHNPKVMFGVTAVGVAISVLISALITWYATPWTTDLLHGIYDGLSPADADELSSLFGQVYASVFALPVSLVFTQIITGVLIRSVSQSVLGKTITPAEVFRGQGGRLARVVGFAVLSVLATVAVGALLIGLVLLVAQANAGLAVLIALVGALAYLAAGLWFSVRTLLVPAGLMLEGGTFWVTVARAWRLTRGSFWRLTGLYLLVLIASAVVSGIVSLPVGVVAALVTQDATLTSMGAVAISSVGEVIATTLTTVFAVGAYALAYIDARMRREGLDVELARAAAQD